MKVFILSCSLLLSLVACQRDPRKPGYQFMPEMVEAVPYESFSQNPNTPKGKTLLMPPKGTVARGSMPYPFSNTPEGRSLAAEQWHNPFPYEEANLVRGKQVYENFCLICHGVAGQGDGPLIPKFPNPPAFSSKNSRKLSEGELYHIVVWGSGLMESYSSQIRADDIWKLVYYVQTLQGKSKEEILAERIGPVITETAPAEPLPLETPVSPSASPETQSHQEGATP